MAAPDRSTLSVWEFVMRKRKKYVQEVLDLVSESVDYGKLIAYASRLRDGMPCRLAEQLTAGGSNVIRLLEFDDGVKWIARILARSRSKEQQIYIQSAIDTLRLAKEHSLPVPDLYGYELSDGAIGRPFILIQFLPGNALVDIEEVHREHPDVFGFDNNLDRLPDNFLSGLADFQLRLTSIRCRQIGRLVRSRGEEEYLPFPWMTKPHSSTYDVLMDYATTTRPLQNLGGRIDQTRNDYSRYLTQVADVFRAEQGDDEHDGFPLVHTDLGPQNIIVDDDLNLVGVIDWEVAWAHSWAFVGVPSSASALLFEVSLFPVERITDKLRLFWANIQEMEDAYIQKVKELEKSRGSDGRLSSALENTRNRCLAEALYRYTTEGEGGSILKLLSMFGIKPRGGFSSGRLTPCAGEVYRHL